VSLPYIFCCQRCLVERRIRAELNGR
jgi:hypothetical protein